jgi:hypothetical protein
MKANSNFKLSKPSKTLIAFMPAQRRHEFKSAMIQAEMAAAVRVKASKDRKSE